MVRKGASSLAVIFIILVVSLLAVSWFRASGVSGAGAQEQIVEESAIESFTHEFEGSKLFLSEALTISAQRGSKDAGLSSGRKSAEEEARYWFCDNNPQIPDKPIVRNTTGNMTEPYLEEYINEAHQATNRNVVDVGASSCVEAGYKQNLDSSENTQFPVATELDHLELSSTEGDLSMEEENLTLSAETTRNRFWYMYSTLKNWVNHEDLKDEVREELRDVPDRGTSTTVSCQQSLACSTATTGVCSNNDAKLIDAVNSGLNKEMNKLEENYFDNDNVTCSFEHNDIVKNGNTHVYPGFEKDMTVQTACSSLSAPMVCNNTGLPPGESTSSVGLSAKDARNSNIVRVQQGGTPTPPTAPDPSPDPSPDPDPSPSPSPDPSPDPDPSPSPSPSPTCPGSGELVPDPDYCGEFEGTTTWEVKYKAYLDYTVTCKDEKFKSIPKDDLENQEWSIDLSYRVDENDIGGGSLNGCSQSPVDHKPKELDTCQFNDQTPNLCNTGYDTTP